MNELSSSIDALIARLQQLDRTPTQYMALYTPGLQVFGHFEALPPGHPYHWDGLKRGADPEHPYLVFQYTLSGWGHYTTNGQTYQLTPGMAFTAIIPSEHRYYLPVSSPGWSFFWVIIRHKYIVERIAQRQQQSGAILSIEPQAPLVQRALELLAPAKRLLPHDTIAHERALFEFFWEHERLALRNSIAQSAAERMIDTTRNAVLNALSRPITVSELARTYGISRSHFSHVFRATTGFAPAHFIQQIRLEEAMQRLLNTDATISSIAQATGFANANHFCRVFRQSFHLSPGAFRRQMR